MAKVLPLDQKNLCAYLKAKRESLGISQRQMSEILNYRANYISILENNKEKIPFAKIPEFIKAYQLKPEFLCIFIKVLHPEFWEIMFDLITCGIADGNRSDIEEKTQRVWNNSFVNLYG